MNRIRKGDHVIVIAGKSKGQKGEVLSVQGDRVVVQNANLVKRHTKPNPQANQPGGIVEREASIHISNVMPFNPATGKGERVAAADLAGAVTIGDVAEPAGDLDDQVLSRESEVDPGDGAAVAAEDDLAVGAGQAVPAQQPQEPTLQVRLAPAVEQQFTQEDGVPRPAPVQPAQRVAQSGEGRPAGEDCGVDHPLQLCCRRSAGSEVHDRPCRCDRANASMPRDVVVRPAQGRPQRHPVRDRPPCPRHEEDHVGGRRGVDPQPCQRAATVQRAPPAEPGSAGPDLHLERQRRRCVPVVAGYDWYPQAEVERVVPLGGGDSCGSQILVAEEVVPLGRPLDELQFQSCLHIPLMHNGSTRFGKTRETRRTCRGRDREFPRSDRDKFGVRWAGGTRTGPGWGSVQRGAGWLRWRAARPTARRR